MVLIKNGIGRRKVQGLQGPICYVVLPSSCKYFVAIEQDFLEGTMSEQIIYTRGHMQMQQLYT